MPATADQFDFSGAAIRARREALGIPREALAIATGRSVAAVTSWERGDRDPGARVRPLIAAALDVAADVDVPGAATARVRAWLDQTREEQGLAPTIEDDGTAEEIADVLRGGVDV